METHEKIERHARDGERLSKLPANLPAAIRQQTDFTFALRARARVKAFCESRTHYSSREYNCGIFPSTDRPLKPRST